MKNGLQNKLVKTDHSRKVIPWFPLEKMNGLQIIQIIIIMLF